MLVDLGFRAPELHNSGSEKREEQMCTRHREMSSLLGLGQLEAKYNFFE
jgi:hypothetical protein